MTTMRCVFMTLGMLIGAGLKTSRQIVRFDGLSRGTGVTPVIERPTLTGETPVPP